jgi:hypothetical protein
MTGVTGCCAPAANGQTVADPAIALMKSRRRIAFPKAQGCADYCSHRIRLQQGFAAGEMGLGVSLHGNNPKPLMSALLPKADIGWR